jgi:hypothetical protein
MRRADGGRVARFGAGQPPAIRGMAEIRVIYMPPPRVLKRLRSISGVERHMDSKEIMRLPDHLVKVGEAYWQQNPAHPKEYISHDIRERKKARK